MNRILLPALVSAAFSLPLMAAPSEADHNPSASGVSSANPKTEEKGHWRHYNHKYEDKTSTEWASLCEKDQEDVKKSLPSDLDAISKVEAEYHFSIVDLEVKALKDENHKDTKKHVSSCRYHLKAVKKIVKKHQHQVQKDEKKKAREKRDEERRAKREAEKMTKNKVHSSPTSAMEGGLDHGRSEGEDKRTAGSDVGVSAKDADKVDSDEKKS